jgi:hypothetical protein
LAIGAVGFCGGLGFTASTGDGAGTGAAGEMDAEVAAAAACWTIASWAAVNPAETRSCKADGV